MKKCVTCKRSLSKSQFNKRSDSSDGLRYSCKECCVLISALHNEKRKHECLKGLKTPALLARKKEILSLRKQRQEREKKRKEEEREVKKEAERELTLLEFERQIYVRNYDLRTVKRAFGKPKHLFLETKKCSRCKLEKRLLHFSPLQCSFDGFQTACKSCLGWDAKIKRRMKKQFDNSNKTN